MKDDDAGAAGSMVAFMVAGILFIGSIAAIIVTSKEGATGAAASAAPAANLKVQAESLSSLILRSSGYTSTGNDWVAGGVSPDGSSSHADTVTRLGLLDATSSDSQLVSYDKFHNLRRAPFAAANDGYVNYPEARASFGLDDLGLDFHIRAYPTLREVQDMLDDGYKDQAIKALYIGDYDRVGGGSSVPQYIKGYIDQADRVIVYFNITNDSGAATIFDAYVEIELKDSKISFTLHTPVLQAGQSGNMTFTVLKTSDWQWKNNNKKNVEFEIHDKDTKLIDTSLSLSSVTMTYSSKRTNVFAESEKLSTVLVNPVNAKYYYEAFDGRGNLVNFADWTYRLVGPDGTIVRTDVLPNVKEGHIERTFTQTGTYKAQLWNDALSVKWNEDNVNLVNPEPGPYGGSASTYHPKATVLPEIRILDALVENFDANAYHPDYSHPDAPYQAGGDVYPDVKDVMNNDLVTALTDASGAATVEKYNVLVVGSHVDHNAMTSQAAKGTIRDWVYAGGTLIVFGSDAQNVNWLQPIFHSSIRSSSGALSTPDVGHPLLNRADVLDYTNYDHRNRVWNFNANDEELFTKVVLQGSDAILAESDPGATGEGNVLLTSWTPYDIYTGGQTADQEWLESLRLVNNLLMQGYRDLFLDYGPPIPPRTNVEPAIMKVHIEHPQFADKILLDMAVYVFPGT